MKILRRINLSAALIGLVCFFLPWVQVSCGGARGSLTGFDLARDGHTLLWLVPVLLAGLALLEILRALRERRTFYSIMGVICGVVTVLLMNRERVRANDESGLVSAQMTGWFWLGLFSALVLVITAAMLFLEKRGALQETNSRKDAA